MPADALESGEASRDETADERADRNWIELLQEMRVLQTGTQILTGFLLALAFQPAFADLDSAQQGFYLVLVVLSALAAIIALAPVAMHRSLFRRGAKTEVVSAGHVALVVSLATVSALLVGVVAFVFQVVLSWTAAAWAGGVLGAIVVLAWVVFPTILRIRRRTS